MRAVPKLGYRDRAPTGDRYVASTPPLAGVDFIDRSHAGAVSERIGVAIALRRLGNRVDLRKAKGLTQEQAAERAGLDAKHFQTIETGQTNVTVASLVGVARSLGLPLSALFAS
jgi:DNA-binding XRE family transcriptional regulator